MIALQNSNLTSLNAVEKLSDKKFKKIHCNLLNYEDLKNIFISNAIDSVIHLAASKGMNSSIQSPVEFYKNNMVGLINLLDVMREHKVSKLIFSSSCAVYGNQEVHPVAEDASITKISSIYARTKYFAEEMLRDVAKSDFSIIILRIFNPIGAHESGLIGEDPSKPQSNILSLFAKAAVDNMINFEISPCVRDFIHVVDVAEAHVAALKKLNEIQEVKIYNIGSGRGTSLIKLVEIFEATSGMKVSFKSKPCGESEIKEIFADTKLAESELNWKSKRSIEDMCIDGWRFVDKFNKIN